MVGMVLAGGNGNRLKSVTDFKPMASVNGYPMINYPLDTLKEMGCDEAVIVTNERGEQVLPEVVKTNLSISYAFQEKPKGMPDAISKVQLDGVFAVIAADFYFDPAPIWTKEPTLFWSRCDNPAQFGIYDPESKKITEKPVKDIGNMAVLACYIYDERVYDVIKSLKPSDRGELEITDLNNILLSRGEIKLHEYVGFWEDMGTPEGLERVANYAAKRT